MKISYNWLKNYHDLDLKPDKLSELLTGCGLEVEGAEEWESIPGGLKGVVIGKVETCVKHPNSDHLSLTTVDTGAAELLKIVCGASNVAAGQKVAVATIGTKLTFADKEITLQRTRIRGEVSEGMICAEDELGLGSSHAGILVLPEDAPVGMPAAEYFRIETDTVFSIGLTPNRVDAASHIGVARDLVAVANNYGENTPDQSPVHELRIPEVSSFSVDNCNRPVRIIVEDPAACPRYSGLTIDGIRVEESPQWLKNRLQAVGLRPINNIVDITNFVLMETGQPLHAFDYDQIADQTVIVRKYPEGTPFVTLDGIERKLSSSDLMICNTKAPMCIAGVFGGISSGVTAATRSVFLESACFDPLHVRKTSKLHGLQTDASFRFERGSDINITIYALKRAALLIREIAGGTISSEVIDIYPVPKPTATVNLTLQHVDRLIGKVIDRTVIRRILTDLGIRITEEKEDAEQGAMLVLEIPSAKVDVTREADVIEEILRIFGYNNIDFASEIRSSLSYSSRPDPEKAQNIVSDYLVDNGFYEMMNNSLTRSLYYQDNPDMPAEKCVRMLNPISRDLDVMRQTLLFGALESISYNMNRKAADLKLFEFGKVYSYSGKQNEIVPGYHEEEHIALIITGRRLAENWNHENDPADIYELKGYVDALLQKLSLTHLSRKLKPHANRMISGGLSYQLEGKPVLTMGMVTASLLKQFDIRQPVVYCEIEWNSILEMIPLKEVRFSGIPRFPEVRRDLALLIDQAVNFSDIEELAFRTEKRLLKEVGLFDVYEGGKIEQGKKSYAVSFILRDDEKTLTDKEIDKVMGRLTDAFTREFSARLR